MEEIAVVGLACKFPHASTPDEFWSLFVDHVDAVSQVPPSRWNAETAGLKAQTGGFVDTVAHFDPLPFNMTPEDASALDPQHRMVLMAVWEALEDAGLKVDGPAAAPKKGDDAQKQAETETAPEVGVFVGISNSDYAHISDAQLEDGNVGNDNSSIANNITYMLRLAGGPCEVVNSSCSSSLVAFHNACCALAINSSLTAIVCGVNAILSPKTTATLSKQGVLGGSKCYPFDERADGYVRGEGCGVVVLRNLSKAYEAGDRVYAVVRGSEINQNRIQKGVASGPSEQTYATLLSSAYKKAGISDSDVAYVEAHGVGVKDSDVAEMKAILSTIGKNREPTNPCLVGSLKGNIGHTESASGIASVIKVSLMLHKGVIPSTLNFVNPPEELAILKGEESPVKVATKPASFASSKAVCGINAFGYGRTNAHVILQQAEKQESASSSFVPTQDEYVVLLTACSESSLQKQIPKFIQLDSSLSLSDIAANMALRRSHHECRLAVVATSTQNMTQVLGSFVTEKKSDRVFVGKSKPNKKLAFVFCGLGSQWANMGMTLYHTEPVFKSMMDQVDAEFAKHTKWSILEYLKDEKKLLLTHVSQITTFALQVSLAALLREWGITADAVIGHSLGEMSAIFVAGGLTLPQAAWVLHHSARFQEIMASSDGRMMMVQASEADALKLIEASKVEKVYVSVVNSPKSICLSGLKKDLDQLLQYLKDNNIKLFTKYLDVPGAFHCPYMDEYSDYANFISDVVGAPCRIPFYSSFLGKLSSVHVGQYFWDMVSGRVNFLGAFSAMLADGYTDFLEIGGHPILSFVLQENFHTLAKGKPCINFASLLRGKPDRASLLRMSSHLFVNGHNVDWRVCQKFSSPVVHVNLPKYQWDDKPYWSESEKSREERLKYSSTAQSKSSAFSTQF